MAHESPARILAAAGLAMLVLSPAQAGGNPAPVTITTVAARDISEDIQGIGIVQPYNLVTVKPQISGQITQITFTEGQPVRRGDSLAKLDSRLIESQLHQAQAALAKDQVQLANAKRQLTRLTGPAVKDYVPRQMSDDQQAQVAALEATVAADEAAIEAARVQLTYATVTAPIDGITGMRMIDVGNMISTADPGVVVITQIHPIAVIFTLPAEASKAFGLGRVEQNIPVTVFDKEDRAAITTGHLTLVDNQIDRSTNTVRLKAVFDNTHNELRPGQFVNVHVRTRMLHRVSTVERTCIQHDQSGPFVWLVRSDSTVAVRRVETGPTSGELVVVTDGLNPGDRVVADGQFGLRESDRISIQTRSAQPGQSATGRLRIP